MAGQRPQPLTLPHGFHFHYTDGTPPKTPERETAPVPEPASPHGFRVRRRARPRLRTSAQSQPLLALGQGPDVAIPSIEAPETYEPLAPALQIYQPESDERYLSPFTRALFAPRTPSPPRPVEWDSSSKQKAAGESIVRPTSAISSLSDSSDASDVDSDGFSYGGSCTSPESDAADPFGFPSPKKAYEDTPMLQSLESSPLAAKDVGPAKKARFTPEMDKHIWTIYMTYIQDPTVTPFKTLPGSSPPLGVCHRVAREARKTWRGGKVTTAATFGTAQRKGSPDTITAETSGSLTPTIAVVSPKYQRWPRSGAATRSRLRKLCRNKATIAPHYQRLMKSRSPSPFTSSSRPSSHAPRVCSPLNEPASFATRDVQIALATSTSSTMQPNGPLAQLARSSSEALPSSTEDWRTAPSAPFASPPPIPSDVEPPPAPAPETHQHTQSPLGSPFIYRTWGPSRSRDSNRPRISTEDPVDTTSIPRLRSPIQLHGTFPAKQKRRAPFPLEDELGPSGRARERSEIDELFGPEPGAGRRVRTRGFTLGAAFAPDGRAREFGNPRTVSGATMTAGAARLRSANNEDARLQEAAGRPDALRPLGSPFAGIRSRPSRARGGHLVTASLGSIQPAAEFTSIDALLHQADHGDNGIDMQ